MECCPLELSRGASSKFDHRIQGTCPVPMRFRVWGLGFEGSDYSAQAQHQVESRLLLDIVVRQSAPILQLFAGEDQALLVGRDALLVLRLRTLLNS